MPTAAPSRFANLSSARCTMRWGWRRRRSRVLLAANGGRVVYARRGMVLDGSLDESSAADRPTWSLPGRCASETRCPPSRGSPGVLPAQLFQAGALRADQPEHANGPRRLRQDRLLFLPHRGLCKSITIAAWRTWRRFTIRSNGILTDCSPRPRHWCMTTDDGSGLPPLKLPLWQSVPGQRYFHRLQAS